VTTYRLDAAQPQHLVEVDNPDGSKLNYTYGTGCGPSADGLCSAGDPNGNVTSFQYQTQSLGPAVVKQLTERNGNAANVTYSSGITTVDRPDASGVASAGERLVYSGIDTVGRVGQLDAGDMSGTSPYLHTARYFWDADSKGAGCRQPTVGSDNNLCEAVRYARPTAPPQPGAPSSANPQPGSDDDTASVYSQEGALLVQRRNAAATVTPGPGQSCLSCFDTTHGYAYQYVFAAGSTQAIADPTSGAGRGWVASPPRPNQANWLFALVDPLYDLTARGNAPGAAVARFMSTYKTDNSAAAPASAPLAGSAVVCSNPSAPNFNTGKICETDSPLDGTNFATSRFVYDQFGQMTQKLTPKAFADNPSSPAAYHYFYYGDADSDLGAAISAGGWMRSIQDPTGAYAYFAYDSAGHVERTWDRNATSAADPGHPTDPPSSMGNTFAETLYAAAGGQPWRYVLSQRDPLSNLTTFSLDSNGNQLTIRPPRGNQPSPATATFDVVRAFDHSDNLLTQTMPVEERPAQRR
jgi:hypothetical protein